MTDNKLLDRLTFIGTGTSTGVPQLGCGCAVCTSADPRDRRLRCSALLSTAGGFNLLIDSGPDFREQMMRAGAPRIDAVVLTHSHYDHVGGMDDLRPMCAMLPGGVMPVYCRSDVERDLRERLPYCFTEHPYPGVPRFEMNCIQEFRPFNLGGMEILPLAVRHRNLDILGYRIGHSLAYITDCLTLPESSISAIRGIDTLVINALRHDEHYSHMNLAQALDVIKLVSPRRAFLVHMSHQIGLHAEVAATLPDAVELAYDGLTIELPT